jgi:TLC ATP/ADP transporter
MMAAWLAIVLAMMLSPPAACWSFVVPSHQGIRPRSQPAQSYAVPRVPTTGAATARFVSSSSPPLSNTRLYSSDAAASLSPSEGGEDGLASSSTSSTTAAGKKGVLSRIASILPPKEERQKLGPLALMFFCILFNYTILRDTKDVLMVTAPKSGAEVIPFLKTYVNLPAAIVRVDACPCGLFGRISSAVLCVLLDLPCSEVLLSSTTNSFNGLTIVPKIDAFSCER